VNRLEVLKSFFRGRTDAWVKIFKRRGGEKEAVTVKEPLTDQNLRDHLEGKYTVAVFPIDEEGKCRFAGWDFDSTDQLTKENILFLIEACEDLGVVAEIYFSGKKGYHIVYFLDGVPSQKAYALNKLILEEAERKAGRKFEHVESYPRHPKIDPEITYSNALSLPWRKHPETGKWANFVDIGFNELVVQEDVFDYAKPLSEEKVDEILPPEWKQEPQPESQIKAEEEEPAPTRIRPLPCIQKMHERKIPEGYRNECLFRYAIHLKELGFDQAFVEDLLLITNQRYCYLPLPDREVKGIAERPFKRNYKGLGCDDPLWKELFCTEEEREKCRYWQSSNFPLRVKRWFRTRPSKVILEVNLPNGGWHILNGKITAHLAVSKAEVERKLLDDYGYVWEDLGMFMDASSFKQRTAEEIRRARQERFEEHTSEEEAMIEMVCRVVEGVYERGMWATELSQLREGFIVQKEEDVIYTLEGLTKQIQRWEQRRIKRPELAIALHALGFKNKQIRIKEKVFWAWLIPREKLEEGLPW